MAKRITIMIDDDLDKKLRMIQAKMIQTTSESVSYSKVINEMLKKGIKK
jgi:predicted transcriptional regulator